MQTLPESEIHRISKAYSLLQIAERMLTLLLSGVVDECELLEQTLPMRLLMVQESLA